MSAPAIAIIQGVNLALELLSASQLVLAKLAELQAKRDAEGKPVTDEDVRNLMAEGDVKAALERAQLAAAKASQDAS
jgi:hypothetical protein